MDTDSLRHVARWALLSLVPVASFLGYRWNDLRRFPEPSVAETVMARQTVALETLVAGADDGPLLNFEQALLVVDQSLVQDLLGAAMPIEGPVGAFHVRIESAQAAFEGGLALIHLNGQATLVESSVTADLKVYAGLVVDNLDPATGLLRCRVEVYGVEAVRANLLGVDQPLRSLTQTLTHGGLSALLEFVEIPVRVDDHLALPALDSTRLDISAARVPIRAQVADVKVFGGKLWVALAEQPQVTPGAPGAQP